MKEFRFAIIGAAKIARNFCDAVSRVDGAKVVAVASKSLERAEAFARETGVPAYYDNYRTMLETEKPDCAYIAVTNNAHFEMAMLCMDCGVPVLCEKAMFMTSREAETFFAKAKEKKLFAMEALWTRFLPALAKARGWLCEGRIGEPTFADFNLGFVVPESEDNRYFGPQLGGGAAYDLTVYGYEITTWMLERPVVRAQVEAATAGSKVDATDVLLLRFEGGIPAVVKTSFVAPLGNRMEIYGRGGRIVLIDANASREAHLYAPDGALVESFKDEITQNGFTYEIEEVMRCIRAGLAESPVVPHADTMESIRLYDRIYETAHAE